MEKSGRFLNERLLIRPGQASPHSQKRNVTNAKTFDTGEKERRRKKSGFRRPRPILLQTHPSPPISARPRRTTGTDPRTFSAPGPPGPPGTLQDGAFPHTPTRIRASLPPRRSAYRNSQTVQSQKKPKCDWPTARRLPGAPWDPVQTCKGRESCGGASRRARGERTDGMPCARATSHARKTSAHNTTKQYARIVRLAPLAQAVTSRNSAGRSHRCVPCLSLARRQALTAREAT